MKKQEKDKWRKAPIGKIARDIEAYVRWLKRELPSRPMSIPDTLAMLERAAEMLKGSETRTRWEVWSCYQGSWFIDYSNCLSEREGTELAQRRFDEMKMPHKVVRRDEILTVINEMKGESNETVQTKNEK